MQLDREGRFKAKPYEWYVKEVNDKPMFEVYYNITAIYENGEWIDWTEYGMTQQAAYWLFKSDGSVNSHAHKCLKECFGWPGRSLEELQNGEWSNVEVQLTCELQTYNNKEKLVVAWTNPGDSVPNSKVSADKLKSLDATWGAKLRAAAGPVTPPKATKETKAKPEPTKSNGPCSIDTAWEFFSKEFEDAFPNGSSDDRTRTWHTIIRDIVKDKEPEKFTDRDWGKVKAECSKRLVLSVEPEPKEIPF